MPNFAVSTTGTETETTTNTETIEFQGETYEEWIEVDGEKIPEISERFTEAEEYRLPVTYSYMMGADIGNSEYPATVYDKDHSEFPNRAIGQTEESAKPDIESAISPGHYFYAVLAANSSGNHPKQEFKEAFHEECEERGIPKNLLVYKKNFPEPEHPDHEFVTIEEGENSWNDVNIPKEWQEEYGGMPTVVMEKQEESEDTLENEESGDSEESEEWDGKFHIPDDTWENCNTDADRMRAILNHNSGFASLEKSEKVENLLEFEGIDSSKSNIYAVLKDWNQSDSEKEDSTDSDTDTVEISQERYDELLKAEEKYNDLTDIVS